MPRHARGFDTEAATKHLSKDRRFAPWLKKLPLIEADPRWKKPFDPVDALARAIPYQQLSGKAAATIVSQVETAIASDRFIATRRRAATTRPSAPAACPATSC